MTKSKKTLPPYKGPWIGQTGGPVGCLLAAVLLAGAVLTGCAGGPTPSEGPPTLAVWTLEDLSLPGTATPDLADLMTARVMTTAEAHGGVALVERERLLAVLRELNLGTSTLADDATALRIGRLAGARMMLFGAYQIIGGQMRLDLRLVAVETGRLLNTARQIVPAGSITARLNAAEAATRDLLSFE